MTIILAGVERVRDVVLGIVHHETNFEKALKDAKELARKHRGLSLVTLEQPSSDTWAIVIRGRS